MSGVSHEGRSRIMAAIHKRNTKPELAVRKFLHARGFRFRLHDTKLPGTPDLVFASRRAVVFIHGCFWHRCPHCAAGRKEVRSNLAYWEPKLARNRARDSQARATLEADGWKVLTVWECETGDATKLELLATMLRPA